MDNQHKLIKGYRDLTESEIAAMNKLKELESQIGEAIKQLAANPVFDQRCVSIARTQIETGFMYAVRAVAQPVSPYQD